MCVWMAYCCLLNALYILIPNSFRFKSWMLWNVFAPHYFFETKAMALFRNVELPGRVHIFLRISKQFLLSLCGSHSFVCSLTQSFAHSHTPCHTLRNVIYFTWCSPFNHCRIMIYFQQELTTFYPQ